MLSVRCRLTDPTVVIATSRILIHVCNSVHDKCQHMMLRRRCEKEKCVINKNKVMEFYVGVKRWKTVRDLIQSRYSVVQMCISISGSKKTADFVIKHSYFLMIWTGFELQSRRISNCKVAFMVKNDYTVECECENLVKTVRVSLRKVRTWVWAWVCGDEKIK